MAILVEQMLEPNSLANDGEEGQVEPEGEGDDVEDVPSEPTIRTEAQLCAIDYKL